MSENNLVVATPTGLQMRSKFATDEAKNAVSGTQFLPYIMLLGSNADPVKEGKFPVGHFALMRGKNREDIGNSFLCTPLSWRPRAMDFSSGSVQSVFDQTHPEFVRIKNMALADGVTGYAFGMEFLLYLPDYDTIALYMFGNKSSRNEAPNMLAVLESQTEHFKIAKVSSSLVGQKMKWHVPVVVTTDNQVTKFPEMETLNQVLNTFNNPPQAPIQETVDADSRQR